MSEILDKEGAKSSSVYNLNDIGSALEAITHAVEIRMPIITEDRFIKEVLPLLQHPWSDENLNAYRRHVKELTNPLRVAGRGENNQTVVLFTVPALYPRPRSTMSKRGDFSAQQLILYVRNEHDRGNHEYDHYVAEYLEAIAGHGDLQDEVLLPLALILDRYDKTFVDAMGKPLYEADSLKGGASKPVYAPLNEDSFASSGFTDDED